MKLRLAQHTVDCSGDADGASAAWRAQGLAWLPFPLEGWRQESPRPPQGPGESWTWACPKLGATVSLLHLVEPGPHGARIHARAELEGPLAWLHRMRLQRFFRARLPEALRAVARGVARDADANPVS